MIHAAKTLTLTATAPIFVGFAGLSVEGDISSEDLTVRPYKGGLQECLLDISQRFDRFEAPGFVLEFDHEWTYGPTGHSEPLRDSLPAQIRELSAAVAAGHLMQGVPDQIRAHWLRNAAPPSTVPSLRWAFPADPIFHSSTSHFSTSWPLVDKNPGVPFSLKALQQAVELRRVEEASFKVALRRCVDAHREQRVWGDRLLDAVIAWEAMAGECQGDVTFRVCNVIAHLVSQRGHRREVAALLKTAYLERNKVVHAGVVPNDQVSLSVACISALIALKQLAGPHQNLLDRKDRFSELCMDY